LGNNTSYLNAGAGFALALTGGTRPHEIHRNIGHRNQGHGLALSGSDSVTQSCNDWFENALGAVLGIDPGPTDLAVDPLFCDVAADDVALRSDSPLANASGCGLVGACSVGCDTTTTPVLVERFDAWRGDDGSIVVTWVVHLDPARPVHLERAPERDGPWTRCEGAREQSGDRVTVIDRTAAPRDAHGYRLVDESGVVLASTRVEALSPAMGFALEAPAANPGPGPFTLHFHAGRSSAIDIAVFDLQGRRTATLAEGTWPAGRHELRWTPAEAGLYFVRYRYRGGEAARRISVTR
jgi:hypothetical protein